MLAAEPGAQAAESPEAAAPALLQVAAEGAAAESLEPGEATTSQHARLQDEQPEAWQETGSQEAIVVMNGCFCPVHAGHLRSLEGAKKVIEDSGDFHVVAGYFAVASDRCVRKKIGGGRRSELERWMKLDARVDLCNAVAPESDWAITAGPYGNWKECGLDMIARHHSKATRIFSVPKEAKAHVYKELTSTAIRIELAGPVAIHCRYGSNSRYPLPIQKRQSEVGCSRLTLCIGHVHQKVRALSASPWMV